MSAPTAGPWIVRQSVYLGADVQGPGGQFVADCGCHENANANACLIAAAPLLLAALRQFHQEATRYHKDCGHGVEGSAAECDSICECIPAAEAAIAKADGR